MRLKNQDLLLANFLHHTWQLELLIESGLLARILSDLSSPGLVLVLKLDKRVLLTESVGVLEGVHVHDLDLQEAVSIQLWIHFRIGWHIDELSPDEE